MQASGGGPTAQGGVNFPNPNRGVCMPPKFFPKAGMQPRSFSPVPMTHL
jgi:hypothetical protein